MDLCSNPSCLLEAGHVPPCKDTVGLLCLDCGEELDADATRFALARPDRRIECASCWCARVLHGGARDTVPPPRESATIPAAAWSDEADTCDDVYAAMVAGGVL